MEPLNDKELNELLQRWGAPGAPAALRERLGPRRPAQGWRWLLTGSIRIPVPVGLAALVALVIWLLFANAPTAPATQPAALNTLADFQPVRQLEPTIIPMDEKNNEFHDK